MRLQPRQSLADGADHFDGVCGGRRDCGGREHHPLFGKGNESHASGFSRCPRDRLYRPRHEHFAVRRVHSHPAYGRHHWTFVPRIRHHAIGGHSRFARRLPDHHTHDVFPPFEASPGGGPGLVLPGEREGVERDVEPLRAQPGPGAAASRPDPDCAAHHHRRQFAPVLPGAQRPVSAAGYRGPARLRFKARKTPLTRRC